VKLLFDAAALHEDLGDAGPRVVLRAHAETVGPGLQDGEDSAARRPGQPAPFGEEIRGLADRPDHVDRAARFPGDIFKGPAKIALVYILPIGLIISAPVDVLRGKFVWPHIIYLIIFTAILSFTAFRFWNYALRRYSSASS